MRILLNFLGFTKKIPEKSHVCLRKPEKYVILVSQIQIFLHIILESFLHPVQKYWPIPLIPAQNPNLVFVRAENYDFSNVIQWGVR
jgi:hypothetical protein